MYEKHEMNIIYMKDPCVFADLDISGDESGGIVVHSANPTAADQ